MIVIQHRNDITLVASPTSDPYFDISPSSTSMGQSDATNTMLQIQPKRIIPSLAGI